MTKCKKCMVLWTEVEGGLTYDPTVTAVHPDLAALGHKEDKRSDVAEGLISVAVKSPLTLF